jgi:methylenetetrahydrofolate reductase (NADPH)
LTHASELVELASPRFSVAVAAAPKGHPASTSLEQDALALRAKQDAGAEFAITDMVFRASDYVGLVERAAAAGVTIPILPGIMPILNLGQVSRMAELSGHPLPDEVVERISAVSDDPAAVRAEGIAMAAELCKVLLAAGAPGLHFYTLNRSKATREIFAALQIAV